MLCGLRLILELKRCKYWFLVGRRALLRVGKLREAQTPKCDDEGIICVVRKAFAKQLWRKKRKEWELASWQVAGCQKA